MRKKSKKAAEPAGATCSAPGFTADTAPFFTPEQAASLVQGEEHRLLIREGKNGIPAKARKELVQSVAKVGSFEEGLRVIRDAIEG